MDIENPIITDTEFWGYDTAPGKPLDLCSICSRDINYGDEYYDIDGKIVCKRCMEARKKVAGEDWYE